MTVGPRRPLRATLIWAALGLALAVPLLAAAASPLLAWRGPVYIAAGFAGIVGLGFLLVQPLLMLRALPGLRGPRARHAHRAVGVALLVAVVLHVAGLWITSPPDVIDALTFTSPTPFSPWGVVAMWAVFATAAVAALRRRLPVRRWRLAHRALAVLIVTCSLVHALLIEGTMEPVSKAALGVLALVATLLAVRRA
ncbi:ferric reductase-like transmembrane domain-containing protein [Roseivivax isoporae]|uniref:Ferric reductase n=1 Tax=Roseivivax isoporae LMG 25204 TaxID=1449351 RepID=X7F3K6_9RHOB|nr:ferric reductase-like transmembrane domain-containing protein [Roseivivax isoporae]ETX26681.1 ferric reductase [Roseivivax isoporae LMG 25204]